MHERDCQFKSWVELYRNASAIGGTVRYNDDVDPTKALPGTSAANFLSLYSVDNLHPQWLSLALQGEMIRDFAGVDSPWWQARIEWGVGNTISTVDVNIGRGTQLAVYASTVRVYVRATSTGFVGRSLAGGVGPLGEVTGHLAPGTPPGDSFTPRARFTALASIAQAVDTASALVPIPAFAKDVIVTGSQDPITTVPLSPTLISVGQFDPGGDLLSLNLIGATQPIRVLPNATQMRIFNAAANAEIVAAWYDFGLTL